MGFGLGVEWHQSHYAKTATNKKSSNHVVQFVLQIKSNRNPQTRTIVLKPGQSFTLGFLCVFKRLFDHTPLKALKPPSMGNTTPVMKEAASEQRNWMAPFNSVMSPKRPMGVLARTFLLLS